MFVEGVIDGIPHGGAFVSAQLTARGEIARYVAFYSARRMLTRESSPTDAPPDASTRVVADGRTSGCAGESVADGRRSGRAGTPHRLT